MTLTRKANLLRMRGVLMTLKRGYMKNLVWVWIGVFCCIQGCSDSEESGNQEGNILAGVLDAVEGRVPPVTGTDISEGTEGTETDVQAPVDGEVGSSTCGDLCPAELCDEATGTCNECNTLYDCDQTAKEWCNNKECVSTLCIPGTLECLDGETVGECTDDGEAWESTACGEGAFCVFGECKEPICEPGTVECAYQQKKICDSSGTSWAYVACPPGFGCSGNDCTPLKNNVVVVMDTSGSMASQDFSFPIGGGGTTNECQTDADCPNGLQCCEDALFGSGASCTDPATLPIPICTPPGSGGLLDDVGNVACVCGDGNCDPMEFPNCESLECPISKLGLAKYTINNLITGGEFDAANVVLQRFPQGITANPSLQCGIDIGFGSFEGEKRGWYYSAGTEMSGDNGVHITIDGDYFDNNMHEVLSVAFPTTGEEDSIAQLSSWIDGDETMEATSTPCQGNNDCPGGYCGNEGGQSVCFYHGSPELRALGGTPLGRALFYAGEYIRRHMVVDGKLCETDADCENVNYYCNPDNGRCFDPLADCRETVIVMMSDGACSGPDDGSANCEDDPFFEPENTAKRLRYGLGCEGDGDCGDGASCEGGTCQGYPTNYGYGGINYQDSQEGVHRLYRYDGQPLQVTTHTIFIHNPGENNGSGMNKNIADNGGGLYFDVETDKPEGLLNAINSILDVKENISQCVPFLPEGLRK